MGQILLNYLVIFIIPLILGFLLQFLLRKRTRYLLPIALSVLAIAAALYASTNPIPGNEGPGLRAIQLGCMAAGSILSALIFRKK